MKNCNIAIAIVLIQSGAYKQVWDKQQCVRPFLLPFPPLTSPSPSPGLLLCSFHPDLPLKKWLRTDGPTDQRTNRRTYRDGQRDRLTLYYKAVWGLYFETQEVGHPHIQKQGHIHDSISSVQVGRGSDAV